MNSPSGFTLIEIIVAVTILAFLSVFTAQSIQKATQNKAKIIKNIDRFAQVRDPLNVISKDIQQAFNFRDINTEVFNKAQKERKKRTTKNKVKTIDPEGDDNNNGVKNKNEPDYQKRVADAKKQTATAVDPKQYELKEVKHLTHFLGQENTLHLTSLNNLRSRENAQESDQMEVGFYLDTCRSRTNKKHRSNCLWRRSTPIIDDKVDEGGSAFVLVENVQEFKLRYLGPGQGEEQEQWLSEWMTNENGTDRSKNKFPFAVEISLKVQDKKDKRSKEVAMTVVVALRFPNNSDAPIDDKTENNQSAPSPPSPPPSSPSPPSPHQGGR